MIPPDSPENRALICGDRAQPPIVIQVHGNVCVRM